MRRMRKAKAAKSRKSQNGTCRRGTGNAEDAKSQSQKATKSRINQQKAEKPRRREPKKPRSRKAKKPRSQEAKEAKKPKGQEAKRPRSQEARKPRSQKAKKPKSQEAKKPEKRRRQNPKIKALHSFLGGGGGVVGLCFLANQQENLRFFWAGREGYQLDMTLPNLLLSTVRGTLGFLQHFKNSTSKQHISNINISKAVMS